MCVRVCVCPCVCVQGHRNPLTFCRSNVEGLFGMQQVSSLWVCLLLLLSRLLLLRSLVRSIALALTLLSRPRSCSRSHVLSYTLRECGQTAHSDTINQKEAAAGLGLSTTALKKVCRKLGIKRCVWVYCVCVCPEWVCLLVHVDNFICQESRSKLGVSSCSCACVCACVCVCVCVLVCMCVCACVCVCVCVDIHFVCMCVCVHLCVCIRICIRYNPRIRLPVVLESACACMCACVCFF